MQTIIFANGDFCPQENPINIDGIDQVVAADGGSRHCQELGIIPNVLIGDMDSTNPDLVEYWEASGVEIIQFPPDKDQTDLELALLHAQSKGANKIIVYGAIGGRLDMTLGNLMVLTHPDLKSVVKLVCGNEEIRVLRDGNLLTLPGTIGDTVSLIPLSTNGAKVTLKGLEYPLKKEVLEFGLTRGISNCMVKEQATIHLESGLLAVIHIRNNSTEAE